MFTFPVVWGSCNRLCLQHSWFWRIHVQLGSGARREISYSSVFGVPSLPFSPLAQPSLCVWLGHLLLISFKAFCSLHFYDVQTFFCAELLPTHSLPMQEALLLGWLNRGSQLRRQMGYSQSRQGYWADKRNQDKDWPFRCLRLVLGKSRGTHSGADSGWILDFRCRPSRVGQERPRSPRSGPHSKVKRANRRSFWEKASMNAYKLIASGTLSVGHTGEEKAEDNRPRYGNWKGGDRHREGSCELVMRTTKTFQSVGRAVWMFPVIHSVVLPATGLL